MSRTTFLLAFVLTTCFLPNGLTLIPQVEEFCAVENCPVPKLDLVTSLNAKLTNTFGSKPLQCGDGICDMYRGETCSTCPTDCGGPCKETAPIRRCKKSNQFALTFDDGPADYTLELLTILKQNDIRATFFVNGFRIFDHGDVLKAVYDAGHVVGSHTYSHRSLDTGHGPWTTKFQTLEFEHMQGELLVNDQMIYDTIGKYPRFVRPPFLEFSQKSMSFMETAGYVPINVNVDSNDWRVFNKQDVLKSFISEFEKSLDEGSWIHLQHDRHKHSVEATQSIIDFLKSHNVEFVPLDVCLEQSAYRDVNDSPFLSKNIQNNVASKDVKVEPVPIPSAHNDENSIEMQDTDQFKFNSDITNNAKSIDIGATVNTSMPSFGTISMGTIAVVMSAMMCAFM